MPSKFLRPFILAVLCTLPLSSCASLADANWVSTKGTVKDVKGINPQGTAATATKKPLYNIVTFQYEFKNREYEASQTVSINAREEFHAGEIIDLKVNVQDPHVVRMDLPPEQPDRTGIKWRRLPNSVDHADPQVNM
jgi:hypothetical protein